MKVVERKVTYPFDLFIELSKKYDGELNRVVDELTEENCISDDILDDMFVPFGLATTIMVTIINDIANGDVAKERRKKKIRNRQLKLIKRMLNGGLDISEELMKDIVRYYDREDIKYLESKYLGKHCKRR